MAGYSGTPLPKKLGIKEGSRIALVNAPKDFVRVDTRFGQLFGVDAPYAGDMCAVLRVGEIASAWKLIAFLAVFASALSVRLAGDGRIATVFAANATRCQHDVDRAQNILNAMAVMLDTARVK